MAEADTGFLCACLRLPAFFKGMLFYGTHTSNAWTHTASRMLLPCAMRLCFLKARARTIDGLFGLTGAKHAHAKRARGVWGDKFPPRRPRVSGARKRLLRTRAKREMRSLLFKSAFRRNAQADS